MRIRLAILFGIPLVTLIVMAGLYWTRNTGPEIEQGTTLVVELSGRYVEGAEAPLFAKLLGNEARSLASVLTTLAMARRDDRIERVVLRIQQLDIGWAKAQELHQAIRRLRDAGRHTIAYVEIASFGANREFYVAAAADELYLLPGVSVPMVGLVAQYLFVSELAEKIGIGFEVTRAGKYKSATEMFTERELSPASYAMAESLLDSTESQFVRGIAEGRGLDESVVRDAIDSGAVLASQLQGVGLIDGTAHLPEILGDGPTIWGYEYQRIDIADLGFEPEARIALVYGAGNVVLGGGESPSGEVTFASRNASEALRDAADDPEIDAILLRIDSPGGSSVAAEVIWAAAQYARARKPLVASFSDLAASGGYYIAAAAHRIVSQPATLTGSIGVFAVRTVDRGLQQKLGVRFQSLVRGRHADLLLAYQPIGPASDAKLQDLVVETYDLFLDRVAEGRGLAPSAVDAVGQGRVWTGEQAAQHGLVDELGGLNVAVSATLELLGLERDADASLIPYPSPRTMFERVAGLLEGRAVSMLGPELRRRALAPSGVAAAWREPLAAVERFLAAWPGDGTMMWLPLEIDIR